MTVVREGDTLTLFTGVGPIGWRRRVRWSEIRALEPEVSRNRHQGGRAVGLALVTAHRRHTVVTGLAPERQRFIEEALGRLLAEDRRGTPRAPGSLGLAEDHLRGELSPASEGGTVSPLGDDDGQA